MKSIWFITTTSFTFIMLIFALLQPYDMAPTITGTIVFQELMMALSIAVMMEIADALIHKAGVSSLWADTLVRVIVCYSVVMLEGAYFGMIPLSGVGLLKVTPIVIPVFLATYAVGYFMLKEWASFINQRIRDKHS